MFGRPPREVRNRLRRGERCFAAAHAGEGVLLAATDCAFYRIDADDEKHWYWDELDTVEWDRDAGVLTVRALQGGAEVIGLGAGRDVVRLLTAVHDRMDQSTAQVRQLGKRGAGVRVAVRRRVRPGAAEELGIQVVPDAGTNVEGFEEQVEKAVAGLADYMGRPLPRW